MAVEESTTFIIWVWHSVEEEMKRDNQMKKAERIILSFTSHKARLPLIDNIFRNHVEVAEALGMDVCFSCQDDSIPYLTNYQKGLIESGKVEILHVPKDHGSNTKWTLCRQAHPDAIMVVVDDDWEYEIEGIRSLLETHQRFPSAIVCRAYRTIPWIGEKLPLYEVRPKYSYPKTATAHIGINRSKDNVRIDDEVLMPGHVYPEHFLGVLYPPNFPSVDLDSIPEECLKDDDVYIGARVAVENRHIVFAGRRSIAECKEIPLPNALWSESLKVNGNGTFNALKRVQLDYISHIGVSKLGSVYLLTCAKYPKRREDIKEELDRLGIRYYEQFDDGTYLPEVGDRHKWLNRCHIAKFLALKKFSQESTNRITLIEDDVRFIKDIAELSKVFDAMPEDFGACRFSWAPSPWISKDMEENCSLRYKEINKALSQPGNFYAKCPYASTDGCTIISREVALCYLDRLQELIQKGSRPVRENSDDLLCRVCEESGKYMYIYKPLVCIQVQVDRNEKGKSLTQKFLLDETYHIKGIVRNIDCYSNIGCKNNDQNQKVKEESLLDMDGFGYQKPLIKPAMSNPMATPSITTRKVPTILPRISPGSGIRHI